MTEQEQNIAIAEACGWDFLTTTGYGRKPDDRSAGEIERDRIPDYCHDLNAMHEAEKFISNFSAYEANLRKVVQGNDFIDSLERCIYATAAQRAEAFLRTIGKWRD